MTNYAGYAKNAGVYFPISERETYEKLPSGVYSVQRLPDGSIIFETTKITSDEILDLPSEEFTTVVGEIKHFIKPATKQKFKDYGFLYKRSALLYGRAGGGKTCIVNRVATEVIDAGGIVLFNPEIEALGQAYKALDDTQKDTLVMVIFEEFDNLVYDYEIQLLSLLDGEVQKNNIIYLMTTNNIEEIPSRLTRPGRISSLIEVGMPSSEAREVYLKHKKIPAELLEDYVTASENFTIDQLKELVLSTICLGQSLKAAANRINKASNRKTKKDVDTSDNNNLLFKLNKNLLRN
jgi:SpoVK/Ycf46/Vps4 family AAA+-type ATPase